MKFKIPACRQARQNSKFKIISISVFCLLFSVQSVFAQTKSNTVTVKVGNPPTQTNATDAGNDIWAAYQSCGDGKSFDNPPSPSSCTKDFLKNKGYPEEKVTSYETRRIGSLVSHGSGYCSECLGYVSTTLALAHNDPYALTFNNPKAVFDHGDTFTVGTPEVTYARVQGVAPKSGDVGISLPEGDVPIGYGHILLVKSLIGEGKFIGLESNWGYDCSVRNYVEHPNIAYAFYRKTE